MKNHSCKDRYDFYPVEKYLRCIRGDSFAFSVRICSNDIPFMLDRSGRVFWTLFGGEDGTPILTKVFCSSEQDVDGFITVSLLPEETAVLEPYMSYDYEVEFRFSDEFVITAMRGSMGIECDLITQEVRDEFKNHC